MARQLSPSSPNSSSSADTSRVFIKEGERGIQEERGKKRDRGSTVGGTKEEPKRRREGGREGGREERRGKRRESGREGGKRIRVIKSRI